VWNKGWRRRRSLQRQQKKDYPKAQQKASDRREMIFACHSEVIECFSSSSSGLWIGGLEKPSGRVQGRTFYELMLAEALKANEKYVELHRLDKSNNGRWKMLKMSWRQRALKRHTNYEMFRVDNGSSSSSGSYTKDETIVMKRTATTTTYRHNKLYEVRERERNFNAAAASVCFAVHQQPTNKQHEALESEHNESWKMKNIISTELLNHHDIKLSIMRQAKPTRPKAFSTLPLSSSVPTM